MADTDFRFDPFRQVFRPVPIVNEPHVAQYFDALGRVGFFTREACQRRSPSTVVVKDASLATLSEVSRTTVPTYSTYRVDYSALTFWSHSFVEVHETRIGQAFTISYHGLGMGLNSSNRADDRFNLERSVTVQGNATAESLRVLGESILRGSVFLATDTGATISASGARVTNLVTSADSDLLSLKAFLDFTSRPQPIILNGSGNWERPANVSKVLFVLVGPGGNGHSAGGGGGGGATVYGVADLDAIGGTMFAYVVGVVGIATTMFGCVAGSGASANSSGSGGAGGSGSVGVDVVGYTLPGALGSSAFFFAIASDGSDNIQTSADGITWEERDPSDNGPSVNNGVAVEYQNGLFVLATTSSGYFTSRDAVRWESVDSYPENGTKDLKYGAGLFVALLETGTNRIYTSPNGTTWTARTAAQANQWYSLVYGNGLFVAVSKDGSNRVQTSPDGITWTARNAAEANPWTSVTYGAGLFVAVATDGSNRVQTSPDGITWTARSVPLDNWSAVQYGGGVFVALGVLGAMNSTDGISWTSRTSPITGVTFESIAYGAGLFVAVSRGASGGYSTMTSPDGITWTVQSTPKPNNDWRCIRYFPAGAGGSSAGGIGGKSNPAELGAPGLTDEFFAGSGGYADEDGENYGGGAGAGGTGADGLILLIY